MSVTKLNIVGGQKYFTKNINFTYVLYIWLPIVVL